MSVPVLNAADGNAVDPYVVRETNQHIDDLVVLARGSGVGRALMDCAEADARVRDMNAIFLDSGPDVVSFYES